MTLLLFLLYSDRFRRTRFFKPSCVYRNQYLNRILWTVQAHDRKQEGGVPVHHEWSGVVSPMTPNGNHDGTESFMLIPKIIIFVPNIRACVHERSKSTERVLTLRFTLSYYPQQLLETTLTLSLILSRHNQSIAFSTPHNTRDTRLHFHSHHSHEHPFTGNATDNLTREASTFPNLHAILIVVNIVSIVHIIHLQFY